METMGIPNTFTATIKSLYTSAKTKVILNGEISEDFPITRGVRQGDPLSCLLFNIAIEPLSIALRESPALHGLEIATPSLSQRIVISLFADDAAVFLSKDDDLIDLLSILDGWYIASGAKFNQEKTVVLPVRTPEHRERVYNERSINPQSGNTLDESITILKDGQTMRYLGAQCGNRPNHKDPWPAIMNNIEKSLTQWNKTYPSIEGRRLITQMTIGGMTQFHTRAQGMPRGIEDHLNKKIREFIWNSDSPPPL
jgi:hypothetical protein